MTRVKDILNVKAYKMAIICLLLISSKSLIFAQSFQSLHSYSSSYSGAKVVDICSDSFGNIYQLVVSDNPSFGDSIIFGNLTLPFSNEAGLQNNSSSFLVKVDSSNEVINAILLGAFMAESIIFSPSHELCVSGFINENFGKINSNKFEAIDGRLLLLRLNDNFQFQWVKQYGGKFGTTTSTFSNSLGNSSLYLSNDDSLFISLRSSDTSYFGVDTYYLSPVVSSSIVCKLNMNNGSIFWSNQIIKNTGILNKFYVHALVKLNNYLFLAGIRDHVNQPLIFGNDSTFGFGANLIKCNLKSEYISSINISTTPNLSNYRYVLPTLIEDGEFLYTGGTFYDSIQISDTIFYSNYPASSQNSSWQLYIASYTTSNVLRWFYQPKIEDNTKGLALTSINSGFTQNGYQFYGGFMGSNLIINDSQLSIGNSQTSIPIFLKSDYLGNILWSTSGGTNLTGYSETTSITGTTNSVYAGGSYLGNIGFGNLSASGNTSEHNGFLVKISDYDIVRGAVNAGPYCSGDSIKIPYLANGEFDSSNYFVAQLSDPEGNFNGDHVELGRIKTSVSDTVEGIIPNAKIASSANYRIRIISTSPVIQSYFVRDSLRLLVYSRDLADPGQEEFLCHGDSIHLVTYGGTRWEWSPAYNMEDSTLRNPLVWPNVDTTYRIVISDSSGCGAIDTAYKKILIRQQADIVFNSHDTTICRGATISIPVKFRYGDTNNYSWTWYRVLTPSYWNEYKTGESKTVDTLIYHIPEFITDRVKLAIILKDNCSPKVDTAFYFVKVKDYSPEFVVNTIDTAICPNSEMKLIVTSSFEGDSSKINWIWKNKSSDIIKKIIGTLKDSMNISLDKTQNGDSIILVGLYDGCSIDTTFKQVNMKLRIPIQIDSFDSINVCQGETHVIKPLIIGGDPGSYVFTWINKLNNQIESNSDSLIVNSNASISYQLIVSDACVLKSDTAEFNVLVRPDIVASIFLDNQRLKDTTLCYNSIVKINSKITGGDSSTIHHFWIANNTLISSKDSIELNISDFVSEPGGLMELQLIAKDKCTKDSTIAYVKLYTHPKPTLKFQGPDTLCFGQKATIKPVDFDSSVKYIWQDENQNIIGTTDQLSLENTSGFVKRSISVITIDQCSIADTFAFNLVFLAPLHLDIINSDTCSDSITLIKAYYSGGNSNYHFTWYEEKIQLLGNSNQISVTPKGITSYTTELRDGCSAMVKDSVRISSYPDIDIIANPSIGCEPIDVNFHIINNLNTTNQFKVDFGDSITLNTTASNFNHNYLRGVYIPSIEATTNLGCKSTIILDSIHVNITPTAAFEYDPQNPTMDNPRISLLNKSKNASHFEWYIEKNKYTTDINTTYLPIDSGRLEVTLVAISELNCADTANLTLFVHPKFNIWVPDAFTPNGDGINDRFGINTTGASNISIDIYNMWGQKVFTGDASNNWDGENALPGVYLYVISLKKSDNKYYDYSGSLLLIR